MVLMEDVPLTAPVVLIIFNRPDTTAQVLNQIRAVAPRQLLVIADAPRPDQGDDQERCQEARALLETVDWDCEVRTQFAEHHMGCRQRVISGLDWVFQQVESAIILEDDCVPHPTFFPYCEQLLSHYQDDSRIFMISGDRSTSAGKIPYSYSFSRYSLIWGWATWRRTWQLYDRDLLQWPELRRRHWLREVLPDPLAVHYWDGIFQRAYEGFDTWDHGLMFTCWVYQGLCIHPSVNLISNIGFRADGTHTCNPHDRSANQPTQAMGFPLRHPEQVTPDPLLDQRLDQLRFSGMLSHLFQQIRVGLLEKRSKLL